MSVPTAGSATGAVGGGSLVPAAAPSYSLAGGAAGSGAGLSTAGMNIAPGLGGAGAGASKGILANIMSSQYTAPALISGGTQLIGGVMQGVGAQKQQERQEQMTAEQRAKYNANIGGFSFAPRFG